MKVPGGVFKLIIALYLRVGKVLDLLSLASPRKLLQYLLLGAHTYFRLDYTKRGGGNEICRFSQLGKGSVQVILWGLKMDANAFKHPRPLSS
jgi:hypothetical protein